MARILVVDDEKVMVKGIRFNLENEGYTVDVGYNGRQAVDLARANDYDLIILDLMMPELDGLEACMEIRAFSSVPIIMLTARGEDTDKLLGFEYGADDYITKPFNILEVKARVKALLRRAGTARRQAERQDQISLGGLTLDSASRATWKDGVPVELTAREFDLLELLMGLHLRRRLPHGGCPHPPHSGEGGGRPGQPHPPVYQVGGGVLFPRELTGRGG